MADNYVELALTGAAPFIANYDKLQDKVSNRFRKMSNGNGNGNGNGQPRRDPRSYNYDADEEYYDHYPRGSQRDNRNYYAPRDDRKYYATEDGPQRARSVGPTDRYGRGRPRRKSKSLLLSLFLTPTLR